MLQMRVKMFKQLNLLILSEFGFFCNFTDPTTSGLVNNSLSQLIVVPFVEVTRFLH